MDQLNHIWVVAHIHENIHPSPLPTNFPFTSVSHRLHLPARVCRGLWYLGCTWQRLPMQSRSISVGQIDTGRTLPLGEILDLLHECFRQHYPGIRYIALAYASPRTTSVAPETKNGTDLRVCSGWFVRRNIHEVYDVRN